jgi:hypothetical protein
VLLQLSLQMKVEREKKMNLPLMLHRLVLQPVFLLLLFDDLITKTPMAKSMMVLTATASASASSSPPIPPAAKFESRERDIRGSFGQRIIKSSPTVPASTHFPPLILPATEPSPQTEAPASAVTTSEATTSSYSNQIQSAGRVNQSAFASNESLQLQHEPDGGGGRIKIITDSSRDRSLIDESTGRQIRHEPASSPLPLQQQPPLQPIQSYSADDGSGEPGEASDEKEQEEEIEDDDSDEVGLNPEAAYNLRGESSSKYAADASEDDAVVVVVDGGERSDQKDDDDDDDALEAHDSGPSMIAYMDQDQEDRRSRISWWKEGTAATATRRRGRTRNPEAAGAAGVSRDRRRRIEEDYEFLIPSSQTAARLRPSSPYPRSPPLPALHQANLMIQNKNIKKNKENKIKMKKKTYLPMESHQMLTKSSDSMTRAANPDDDDNIIIPYSIRRQIDPSIRLILSNNVLSMFLDTNRLIMNSKIRRVSERKWHRIRHIDLSRLRQSHDHRSRRVITHKWPHRKHGYGVSKFDEVDWNNLIR